MPVTLPKDAPDVDEALAAIALRAAALDPAARFQSAEDFRVALDAWLNPQEAPSAPAGSGAVDSCCAACATAATSPHSPNRSRRSTASPRARPRTSTPCPTWCCATSR
ncbi:hypothetical protein [Thauera humireducens]|uniref:hypothetical protein n=1 Tax=Thauera humireducens TaxID=1134435 RepID=UPI00311E3853